MKKLIYTFIMLVLAIVMVLPFVWMISTSFKLPSETFTVPVQWIPKHWVLTHHMNVWTGEDSFLRYYANSLKIAIIGVTGASFFGAIAAYAFARIDFKGKQALFILYLAMMMMPPQVLFVSKFIMFNWIGIYNTHWALIIPAMVTIFGVFLMRQFFISIPKEISESAFIDGAGHFRIFFKMMLPLAKPALVTFAIIDFSWQWNDYENALIFLIDKELYTIPLGMQNFIAEHTIDYNGMMAAASAGIIPMIIVFLLGQRFIIEGVASSAVKG